MLAPHPLLFAIKHLSTIVERLETKIQEMQTQITEMQQEWREEYEVETESDGWTSSEESNESHASAPASFSYQQ